jgi:hypothetical protein
MKTGQKTHKKTVSGIVKGRRTSLATLKPLNLGKTLRPLSNRDDLLGEIVK